jgi:HK97 gp10 family phage protein
MVSAVRYTKRYEQAKEALNKAYTSGLRNVGRVVHSNAVLNVQRNKSIDTGRLINSLSYSILGETVGGTGYTVKISDSPTTVYIGTQVSYAPYVEFGSKFQRAKSFLRTAYSSQKSNVPKIIKETIKALLKNEL